MLRTLRIIGCLTALVLISIPSSFAQDDLKSAIKLTESEQFETARKSFDALIAKEPNNGDNYYYYGLCWIRQFMVDSMSVTLKEVADPALLNFNKGIEKDPANPLNYIGSGRVKILLGKYADASKDFQKAKDLMPLRGMNYKKSATVPPAKQALAYAKIAEAMLKSPDKKKEELLDIIENAVERDANVSEVYLIKGDIYLEYNDGSNAIIAYNKANDLDPLSCKAMVKIGQLWVRGKAYTDALGYYKDAIKIDSAFAPAYRERAELYGLAGQWENAIKDYQKFLDLSGKNTYAKVRYASFLFMAKKYEEALSVINEVLATDQSYTVLYRIAGYSYYETAKYPEGLKSIETFFKESKPEKIIVSDYVYWGDLLVKTNDDKLAIEKYQKAYEIDSTNCDLLSKMAKSYTKIKDYPNSIIIYEKKLNKNCITLNDYYEMGKNYYNLQQWEKADTAFGTVLAKKPDFYNAINYRAKVNINIDTLYKLGSTAKYYEMLIPLALKDSVKNIKDIYTAYDYLRFYYYKQYLINKKCEDAKKSIAFCEKILAIDPKDQKALDTRTTLKTKCPN